VKIFNWDSDKNEWLKENRGISFEDVLLYLANGFLLDDVSHPNQEKYPNQRIMAVNIDDYVYLIPYMESATERYLKTIIPSRKATKKYLGETNDK